MRPSDGCAFIACVPFTVEDLAPLQPPFALQVLTGPIDHRFSGDGFDPHWPSHTHYVLAVPLHLLDAGQAATVNFILGNTQVDSALDEDYAQLWVSAFERTSATQCVFAYLFAAVAPGVSQRDACRPDATLPDSAWLKRSLAVLTEHAKELNERNPTLGMRLLAPQTLCAARTQATDLRMSALFKERADSIGERVCLEVEESLVSDPQLFRRMAKERNDQEAPAREHAFGTVVLGQCSFATSERGWQMGQLMLLDQDGFLKLLACPMLPLGTRTSRLLQWWQHADPEGLAAVVELPLEVRDKAPVTLETTAMCRDPQGRWTEYELLQLGPHREVLKTATWSRSFGALELQGSDRSEPGRRTAHPLDLAGVADLETVLRNHYRDDVASSLQSLARVHGLGHRDAMQRLMEEYPQFAELQLVDPYNAVPPTGLWAALHHQSAKGVLFRVRQSLQDALEMTDVDQSFPMSFLRSPYPDVYVELASRAGFASEAAPADSVAWAARLEGAYVSDRLLDEGECHSLSVPAGTRCVTLTPVVESGDGPRNLVLPSNSMLIRPEDTTSFHAMLHTSNEASIAQLPDVQKEAARKVGAAVLRSTMLICKVLLYSTLKAARMVRHFERSDMLERARAARGRERDRLFAQARQLHDYVEVGPETGDATQGSSAVEGRSVAVHWRRGYIRSQPHGPQHSLRRPVWIAPVLVNAEKLADEPSVPKDYVLV